MSRQSFSHFSRELYRLLLRTANQQMHSPEAKSFVLDEIRSRFRKNRYETNPKKVKRLLQRGHDVLLAMVPKEQLEREVGDVLKPTTTPNASTLGKL